MGQDLLGPVQFIIDLLEPILVWTRVDAAWIQLAALNTLLLTSWVAKYLETKGWVTVAVAAVWALAYSAAKYLPDVVPMLAGTAVVLLMTAGAMKVGGLIRVAKEKMVPMSKPSVRND